MYADDVVFLAESINQLRAMNEVMTGYAKRNRYRLNGEKSAVMTFNERGYEKAPNHGASPVKV